MGIRLLMLLGIALGQSGSITIPPGYYSLPQLAQELSSQDHTVTCSQALKNRLAYVSIRDRPVSEVKSLVTDVLGVSFSTASPVTETMEPLAKRQSEERLLERALKEYYADRVNAVMSACSVLLPIVTPASIDANMDRPQGKQPSTDFYSAAQLLFKLGDGDFSALGYYVLSRGVDFDSLIQKDAIEVGNEHDMESAVPAAWRDRVTLRTFFERSTRDLPVSQEEKEAIIQTAGIESYGALRLGFDPYSGHLSTNLSLSFRPDANSGARMDVDLIPELIGIDYPRLSALGGSAWVKAYSVRRSDSDALLNSNLVSGTVTTPADCRAVSEYIASWAGAMKKDVVMEVSQGRDMSPARFATGRAMSGDLRHELLGVGADFEAELSNGPAENLSLLAYTAVQPMMTAILAEPTYTCRMEGDILCVRDEFGFLDHLYNFPSDAIARLESNRLASENRVGALVPTLDAIEAYCRETAPAQAGTVSRCHCAIVPPDLTATYPMLRSVFQAASLKRKLLESISSDVTISQPIASFKDFGIERFCRDIADVAVISNGISGRGASPTATALYPTLSEILAQSKFQVVQTREGKLASLAFTFFHRHYLPIPRVAADGTLTHESTPDDSVPVMTWGPVQFLLNP
jgi:hypothetical protein